MKQANQIVIFILLVVLSLILELSSAAAEPTAASAEQLDNELNTFRAWLVDAWNKQDIDKILSKVEPDVLVTWQDGRVSHGREELRQYIEHMVRGPQSVVEHVTANPVVEGRKVFDDHIISWGHMNDVFILREDGEPLHFDSRFSALLQRKDNVLMLAGIHFSVNAFKNDVQSLAVTKTRNYSLFAGLFIGLLLGFVLARTVMPRDKK